MPDHDFYAEATLFDIWQARIGKWLAVRFSGLSPYWWVLGFGLLGSVFLVTGLSIFAGLMSTSMESGSSAWNQSFAQTVTILVALTATQTLYRQALDAWPRHLARPACWQRLGHYVGWQRPVERPVRPTRATPPLAEKQHNERQAVQAFFASVRAAGVNVAIARALFGAGIRSADQLLKADDDQLRAIHGVGPATIRKLRCRFREAADHAA